MELGTSQVGAKRPEKLSAKIIQVDAYICTAFRSVAAAKAFAVWIKC